MTRKQRFLSATTLSAIAWAAAMVYIFSYNVHAFADGGILIPLEPPRFMVMLVTLVATVISVAAWRWYQQNRVERALTGLNAEERRELHTRLVSEEFSINDDDDYDVVLSPRKRKLSEE